MGQDLIALVAGTEALLALSCTCLLGPVKMGVAGVAGAAAGTGGGWPGSMARLETGEHVITLLVEAGRDGLRLELLIVRRSLSN